MAKRLLADSDWIWTSSKTPARNAVVCFRRTINAGKDIARAALRITADARYELFVNGQWLGHGPARAWPSPWPVDEYDLASVLSPGKNVIAVLVRDIGVGTFQYFYGRPGLIAELDLRDSRGSRRIVTDDEWSCKLDKAYAWPTPRISCQQAWEEQFDARLELRDSAGRDWRQMDYAETGWRKAKVVLASGEGPHERFELRDIPMLTREVTEPARVVGWDVVGTAAHVLSINPRTYLNPHDLSANRYCCRMFLATFIHSDVAQTMQLHDVSQQNWGREIKVNGRGPEFDDHSLQLTDMGVAHVKLKKGWNQLLIRQPYISHILEVTLNIRSQKPVRFAARPSGRGSTEQAWLIAGPFSGPVRYDECSVYGSTIEASEELIPEGADEVRFEAIWKRGRLSDKEIASPICYEATGTALVENNVYALCASERVVDAVAKVDDPMSLQRDNAEWTTVYPSKDGDVRVLLDFGREVVGYHEFEIDAPEGTFVDNHNFEFIQRDGRVNLGEGMTNSFRYICREGAQTYRTLERRGFRYSWISLRNFKRPVKIRMVRMLMSTYPTQQQGDFACSDPMLERIWHVGAHSVKCCSEDTYTDCPSYEQTFWVGDGRNEALVDMVVNGDPRLSWHCWLQAARSLNRSPLVEGLVPSAWWTVLPAWSFLWMRWAQEHYMLTGDKKQAAAMMPWLDKNVRGLEEHIDDRGLFDIVAWNMFDWAPMDTPFEGVVTHQNCLAVLALRQCVGFAKEIGRDDLAERWGRIADDLANAINRHLWCDKKQAYVDCIHADGRVSDVFSQQTHTAANISGVAGGKRAERCRQIVAHAPEGFVEAGSPFFMFFLLEALVKEERFDEMIDTIKDYWGIQIEEGATTFYETYYHDKERKARSHCHGWSAAPTYFLSQHVLGISPEQAGYATVRIAPKPGDLKWAAGRVPTPHGLVSCRWRNEDDQFTLELNCPDGLPAVIELPVKGKVIVQEGCAEKVSSTRRGIALKAQGPRVVLSVSK